MQMSVTSATGALRAALVAGSITLTIASASIAVSGPAQADPRSQGDEFRPHGGMRGGFRGGAEGGGFRGGAAGGFAQGGFDGDRLRRGGSFHREGFGGREDGGRGFVRRGFGGTGQARFGREFGERRFEYGAGRPVGGYRQGFRNDGYVGGRIGYRPVGYGVRHYQYGYRPINYVRPYGYVHRPVVYPVRHYGYVHRPVVYVRRVVRVVNVGLPYYGVRHCAYGFRYHYGFGCRPFGWVRYGYRPAVGFAFGYRPYGYGFRPYGYGFRRIGYGVRPFGAYRVGRPFGGYGFRHREWEGHRFGGGVRHFGGEGFRRVGYRHG